MSADEVSINQRNFRKQYSKIETSITISIILLIIFALITIAIMNNSTYYIEYLITLAISVILFLHIINSLLNLNSLKTQIKKQD
jgi:hypothetical protein